MEKNIQAVTEAFECGDDISIPLIQRKCKLSYNAAKQTYDRLVSIGAIKPGANPLGVSKYV